MTDNRPDEVYEEDVLRILAAAVRAIGSIISSNTEIVLHDLRRPEYSIAEIVNAHVTGRRQGDSILSGMRTDKAFISAMEESREAVTLLTDYETFSRSGAPLRSSTAIYRGRNARPFAALCINVDHENIRKALSVLQSLTAVVPSQREEAIPQEESGVSPDNIEDLMRDIISSATALSPGAGRADGKRAKLLAVQQMQEKGIFLMKGGVEKAAAALGVTRYTIYNYLDELKNAE